MIKKPFSFFILLALIEILLPSWSFADGHANNREMGSANSSSEMSGMNHDDEQMHSMSHGGHHHPMGSGDCSEMEVFDYDFWMCRPLPMKDMPMKMLMVHGNLFGGETIEQGPRGRSALWSTSMVMADVGTSVGDRHYVNLDVMTTAEKWTLPDRGYPELLQIGEHDANGVPFLDAQHPHSSPIMGLTLSDTIAFGQGKDHVKIFFAPRGQSTDGPVAFMHRPTGVVNPDAPLGHHIGQDVGHISSTVLGGSLRFGETTIEASTFHGAEPEPEKVDLPIGKPDSYALRAIEEFSPSWILMGSAAYINQPEPDDPDIAFESRYSASLYNAFQLSGDWMFHNALIYGLVTKYDHADTLSSFAEEFAFHGNRPTIWGRIELLQRTPAELEISAPGNPNAGLWVAALTAGYTHKLASWDGVDLGLGGSVTKDLLPGEYINAYGGNPWSGKIFLQLGGMEMWNL